MPRNPDFGRSGLPTQGGGDGQAMRGMMRLQLPVYPPVPCRATMIMGYGKIIFELEPVNPADADKLIWAYCCNISMTMMGMTQAGPVPQQLSICVPIEDANNPEEAFAGLERTDKKWAEEIMRQVKSTIILPQ